MATRDGRIDRGARIGGELARTLGREAGIARRDHGLSLRTVADALGVSPATVWCAENGLSPAVSLSFLARMLAVVGLELSARACKGSAPIRDAGHAALISRFQAYLHHSLRWAPEVPLSRSAEARGWDGVVLGRDWRYGVGSDTNPMDAQDLVARAQFGEREGDVDGVLLIVPDTRRVGAFLAGAQPLLEPHFRIPGPRALDRLLTGLDPGGNALIVLRSDGRPASWPRFGGPTPGSP
jgi:transcriptional regulator with XRE-family HTH domain